LELEEHAERLKERVPTEEEDPRKAPHEQLRSPVAGEGFLEGGCCQSPKLGEREREFEGEGNSSEV
jgi:hypothetical protein